MFQYKFDVTETEDECLFELTQKSGRGKEGDTKTTIGFTIMKVGQRVSQHPDGNVIQSGWFQEQY